MNQTPPWKLLSNRNFMLAWWAGLVSWLGNYTLFIALPIYVYGETDSTLATGFSVMANALPTIVVGQVAGVFVDRWSYKRTMVIINLLLGGVTLLFLGVLSVPWWLVIPVAFVRSSIGQFLGPAENALLPTLVSAERLAAANSLNALNNNLARLVGPAAGGLIIASMGFSGVVIVNALTYLLAALLILAVSAPKLSREPSSEMNPYRRLVGEWLTGLHAVRSNRLLRLSFVAGALVGLGEGFISTLMAPWVKVMLGGEGLELGYLMSAQAVGSITAGILLTGFADRIPTAYLLGWGGLLSGLLLVPLLNYPLVYPVLWPGLILTAVAGFPFAMWGTAQMTLLQSQTEPQVRGRVFSAYFALFGLAQLIGMLASGLLGDILGIMIINIDAVMYLLAGVIVLTYTTRHLSSQASESTHISG
jgi:MFS family permease